MSAEVENSKEEEVREQKVRRPLKKRLLEQWPVGIKILELLVCAICMGLIYDPLSTIAKETLKKNILNHVGIMYTAYTGYMVINCVLLISRVIGDKIPYRTVSLFAIIGSALFLITGIVLTIDKRSMSNSFLEPFMYMAIMMSTAIIFTFVNLVLFAIEAVLMYVKKENY